MVGAATKLASATAAAAAVPNSHTAQVRQGQIIYTQHKLEHISQAKHTTKQPVRRHLPTTPEMVCAE